MPVGDPMRRREPIAEGLPRRPPVGAAAFQGNTETSGGVFADQSPAPTEPEVGGGGNDPLGDANDAIDETAAKLNKALSETQRRLDEALDGATEAIIGNHDNLAKPLVPDVPGFDVPEWPKTPPTIPPPYPVPPLLYTPWPILPFDFPPFGPPPPPQLPRRSTLPYPPNGADPYQYEDVLPYIIKFDYYAPLDQAVIFFPRYSRMPPSSTRWARVTTTTTATRS